jgi:predicted PurR-regulated permease PerM
VTQGQGPGEDTGDRERGAAREAPDDERRTERLGERLTQQLAQQWALIRAERRAEPEPVTAGTSNFSRAQVPWGLDLAAAWSWRLIVIAVAALGLLRLLSFFAVITLPLAVSLLIAALASPGVRALHATGLPRGLAAGVVVLLGLGAVGLLLTVAGQQVANGASGLADQVVQGLGKIRTWLQDGPLDLTDSQVNTWIQQTQRAITERSRDGEVLTQVTEVGTTIGHVVAGFFIILFATYFFLADGHRIWAWLVRLAPRAARGHFDSSGRVAWVSLTQFVRATVIVALVDAIGVVIVAAVLGVPFVMAIGVLVFLGAFVPMVGATVAGAVAVLVALVDQGPVTALLMLGGVILVQQIEGHVLQPFLMGRFVSLHPLGVIVAIGCGVLVAGIAGALIAVPLAAAANAVVQHLAADTAVGEDDPDEALDDDLDEVDPDAPPVPADDRATPDHEETR